MATLRQKKLAKAIVDNSTANEPLNKKELLVSSGYSEVSATASAKDIIEQVGVQEELELLGFTERNAKTVVGEILLAGENDTVKLKAADMVFKVHGTYAPEKRVTINLDGELTEREQTIARELLQAQRD